MNDIRRVLSYNDVLLVPRYSGLDHISDADIKISYSQCAIPFTGYPIVNAPMDKVCSPELLRLLHDTYEMPVTIHRWFDNVGDQIKYFESCNFQMPCHNVFLSVGNYSKWPDWVETLVDYSRYTKIGILVDVANGDTKSTIETVKYIKNKIVVNVMSGNVATKSGFIRLQEAGSDFIRCGIGGGAACDTRKNLGMGLPTLTSVIDCARAKEWSCLISDGGIENPGDICKALHAGADMVMVGKMLAATSLSGGEKIDVGGKKYVRYSGMASKEAIDKLKSKKSIVSIEGASGLINYTGETDSVMNGILGNLQTSVAYYAGCKNWLDFKRKVKMVEITGAGLEESKTRLIQC